MSDQNNTTSAPVLRQSVKFGERYVSSALNRKFAGILATGVYKGYVVKPGGKGRVLVTNEEGYPRSIAVLERDGYNMTITMDDPGYVEIPATGEWYIVIEALYLESQPGYQRIVARETLQDYHIVLAKVVATDMSVEITEDDISTDDRNLPEGRQSEVRDMIDACQMDNITQAINLIKLSDRLTRHELEVVCTGGPVTVIEEKCDCNHIEGGAPLLADPEVLFEHALYGDTDPDTVSG